MSQLLRSVSNEGYPESFYCPMTFELMTDPVVCPNGTSYERSAITEWVLVNHSSPTTRLKMELDDLRPNRTLKDMIEAAVQHRAATQPTTTSVSPGETKSSPQSNATDTVTLQVNTRGIPTNDWCLASIKCTEGTRQKTPVDICVVIDTSGSMCSEAKRTGENGATESDGLSILDVVKHATTTIIEALGPEDRLAIVSYSSRAHSVLPLTVMHNGGKALAKQALTGLSPSGSTNLWDGLKMGLDLLASDSNPKRLTSCFILTDGCPNIVPPRGHLPMLRRYKDSASAKNDFSCVINTYGFGYNLDSTLLDDLAREGMGSYSFIPDSGFVGTIFTNALANLCSTLGKKVRLTLEPMDNTSFEIERYHTHAEADEDDDDSIGKRQSGTYGGHPCTRTSWGWSLDLGCLRYGQTKDIVVRIKSTGNTVPAVRATLSYDYVGNGITPVVSSSSSVAYAVSMETESSVVATNDAPAFDMNLMYHTCRLEAVDTIYEAHALYKEANSNAGKSKALIANLILKFQSMDLLTNDKRGRGLMKDLSGQVAEAFSKSEYYIKWGQHYLPSLAGAHLLQQCNNFKDSGVQSYGGTLFNTLRDQYDDIFNKLPPPKPSRRIVSSSNNRNSSGARGSGGSGGSGGNGGSGASSSRPLASMASYNCRSAPCFPGNALVSTINGKVQRIDALQPGDLVQTGRGETIGIDLIVKTKCCDGQQKLVTLKNSGLQVTPWHPIKMGRGKAWSFPDTLVQQGLGSLKVMPCEAVYSFMLPKGHTSMVINGIECITLGHGVVNDKVASHPFYGTDAVRENVQQLNVNETGVIELQGGMCVRRCRASGLVCELYQ